MLECTDFVYPFTVRVHDQILNRNNVYTISESAVSTDVLQMGVE